MISLLRPSYKDAMSSKYGRLTNHGIIHCHLLVHIRSLIGFLSNVIINLLCQKDNYAGCIRTKL